MIAFNGLRMDTRGKTVKRLLIGSLWAIWAVLFVLLLLLLFVPSAVAATAVHRAGRPVVLVQNAIHAGEMDGKDALLALLR
ncbi:MAG TPA: hypothetical protein VGA31_00040 [Thermoanaerobaculia bacterium]